MEFHAWAAQNRGDTLQPWTYDSGDLEPQEVRVRVDACGLCHSDIHMIDNDWGATAYPLVPGHEVIGTVDEVGSHVTHLKPGDRVGIGWQRSACLTCEQCLHGNENLCDQNRGLIVGGHGGFADYLHCDAAFCFLIPDGVATEKAGPLLCGGITVYSALMHAGMRNGQEIGIIGVGGLGHMAVQFASKLGNRVTVFTTSQDKADFAAEMGAHEVVLTGKDEPVTSPQKLDILLSTAPANLAWDQYLNTLGPDGTMCFVAIPSRPLQVHVGQLLGKRKRIMASPIGGRGIMTDMLHVADRFGVEPITEEFPFDRINDAIQKVRDNTIRYRGVVVRK